MLFATAHSNTFENNAKPHRDVGELQTETQKIISTDGKYYQSYVSSSSALRYVFVSSSEYTMSADWDWVTIGTDEKYSLDQPGSLEGGYR